MALRRKIEDDRIAVPGQAKKKGENPFVFKQREDVAAEKVWTVWKNGVRAAKWPEKSLSVLREIRPDHYLYAYAQLVLGYHLLDLGIVDEALASFVESARTPSAAKEYPRVFFEVAFVLAGFFQLQDAAQRWSENAMASLDSIPLNSYYRSQWAIVTMNGDSMESKRLRDRIVQLCGDDELTQSELDWMEKVESGEWTEEIDEELSTYRRNQLLEPPDLARIK